MTQTPEERWTRWSNDFDEVEHNVMTLFHTRAMHDTVQDLIEQSGVPRHAVVENHLARTYVTTICSGVRREVDLDTRTTSLARCLQKLTDAPRILTKARYSELARAGMDDPADWDPDKGFKLFAPDGGDMLDTTLITADLERLVAAVSPIRRYTNKVLAHRERWNHAVEPLDITFDDIDRALRELGDVVKKYYGLRHPGVTLAQLTPVVELSFLTMFSMPWFPPGSTAPAAINHRD